MLTAETHRSDPECLSLKGDSGYEAVKNGTAKLRGFIGTEILNLVPTVFKL
jgi:hypothetical protein